MKIAENSIWNYTIVYCESFWGRRCAERIRDAIYKRLGVRLMTSADSREERECEILVGKTNRRESRDVRSGYGRPNLNFEVRTVGSKLVVMGEGYLTLERATAALESAIADGRELRGEITRGDTCDDMTELTEGADLRVFNWNFHAPYLADAYRVYTNDTERGEVMADIMLRYLPDIIHTNELYEKHWSNPCYSAIMRELSEYYEILDKSPYDVGKPYDWSDVVEGRSVCENILYKKGIGLTPLKSGWRYLSELNSEGKHIYCHGTHTAAFENAHGRRFITSVGHYADSRANDRWAREHQAAVRDMQNALGAELPVIMTGDMFTFITYGERADLAAGYLYHRSAGFVDSQLHAEINANENVKHGTFHTIGVRQTNRCSEDFVWLKGEVRALKFKVLTSKEIDDASDHYPVMADLRFG